MAEVTHTEGQQVHAVPEPHVETPLASQRSRRARKQPPRFKDMDLSSRSQFLSSDPQSGPSSSDSESDSEPEPEPEPEPDPESEPTPEPDILSVSAKDQFGLFTVHRYGLPSRNPDEDNTVDDLVDMRGFAVTRRKGCQPGQVFGRRKLEPQPSVPATANKQQQRPPTADDEDGSRIKEFSMNTIKTHMLTHYPYFIRKFGSLDSYTTRMGEREHVRTKRLYGRTNKRNHEPQMAVHHKRSRMLHSIRVKTRFVEHHKSNGATYVLPDHERLPLSNPKERY
ncbi:hypothetical protein PQX77_018952 [Marasmius sp. AFHP31]|nr:hypothetical protein PQX77_018952 [Marasmius sp. AFHP31]